MLEFSPNTNLLMQSKYRYELQDVEEPNLYRELFDYKAIPKVAFNNRVVPVNMPKEIWMTDTTFRDGQQSVFQYHRFHFIVAVSVRQNHIALHIGSIHRADISVDFVLCPEVRQIERRMCANHEIHHPCIPVGNLPAYV